MGDSLDAHILGMCSKVTDSGEGEATTLTNVDNLGDVDSIADGTTIADVDTSDIISSIKTKKMMTDFVVPVPLPEYPLTEMNDAMVAVCRLFRGLEMVAMGSVSVLTSWYDKEVINNTHASCEYGYIKMLIDMFYHYSCIVLHRIRVRKKRTNLSFHHKAMRDTKHLNQLLARMGKYHQVGEGTREILRAFSDARRSILDAVYTDARGTGAIDIKDICHLFTNAQAFATKLFATSKDRTLTVFFMLCIDPMQK